MSGRPLIPRCTLRTVGHHERAWRGAARSELACLDLVDHDQIRARDHGGVEIAIRRQVEHGTGAGRSCLGQSAGDDLARHFELQEQHVIGPRPEPIEVALAEPPVRAGHHDDAVLAVVIDEHDGVPGTALWLDGDPADVHAALTQSGEIRRAHIVVADPTDHVDARACFGRRDRLVRALAARAALEVAAHDCLTGTGQSVHPRHQVDVQRTDHPDVAHQGSSVIAENHRSTYRCPSTSTVMSIGLPGTRRSAGSLSR